MTLTYQPTIRLYLSDGNTPDTSFFAGGMIPIGDTPPEFTWSVYGGCISGKLSIALPEAARHPFVVAPGQVVKAYQFSGDTVPIWAGVVDDVSRAIGEDVHEVSLRGLFDLVELEVDEDLEVGSQAAGTIDVAGASHPANEYDTAAKIIGLLLDRWIIPSGSGITCQASDLVGDMPRAMLRLRKGTSLKRVIAELALMCEGVNVGPDGTIAEDPQRWSYGVDGSGKFFFRPIPPEAQNSIVFGVSIIGGGRERPASAPAAQQVTVLGDVRRDRGIRSKRTLRHHRALDLGPSKPLRGKLIRVLGSSYKRDLTQAAQGWLSRYAAPSVTIDEAIKVEASPAAVPLPWLGRIRWSDPARGLDILSYTATVRAVLGPVYSWNAGLGLGISAAGDGGDIDGGADPYAPSLLDDVLEGSEAAAASDEVYDWPECSEGIAGDMEYPAVDPPVDEPAFVGTDLLTQIDGIETDVDALQGGLQEAQGDIDTLQGDVQELQQGGSGRYPAFTILDLTLSSLAAGANTRVFHALVANGGQELNATIELFVMALDASGNIDGSTLIQGTRLTLDEAAGLEVWTNAQSATFVEGTLYAALRITLPGTDPAQYIWYPAPIDYPNDYTRGIAARIGGTGGGTIINCIGFAP